jgi:hypothetical protein
MQQRIAFPGSHALLHGSDSTASDNAPHPTPVCSQVTLKLLHEAQGEPRWHSPKGWVDHSCWLGVDGVGQHGRQYGTGAQDSVKTSRLSMIKCT